jgi:hypothetical protein
MMCCEYSTFDHIHKAIFSSQLKNELNKLEFLQYFKLERFATDKHSSSKDQFVNYKENDVLWIQYLWPYSQSHIFFAT